jgi:hypothetical protein
MSLRPVARAEERSLARRSICLRYSFPTVANKASTRKAILIRRAMGAVGAAPSPNPMAAVADATIKNTTLQ